MYLLSTNHYGAPFIHQVYYAFNRSLHKQLTQYNVLILELFLACISAIIIGAVGDFTGRYQGVLIAPYEFISPVPKEATLVMAGVVMGFSIGITASTSGVRVVSEELNIIKRETSAQHSLAAYFIGSQLAQIFRIFIASLHYAAFYYILCSPYAPFEDFLWLVLSLYCCLYGFSAFISSVTSRFNAPLASVFLCIIFGVANGYVDVMPQAIKVLSPTRWFTNGYFDIETHYFRHIMQVETISTKFWSYDVDVYGLCIGVMFAMGIGYRLLCFLFLHRKYHH